MKSREPLVPTDTTSASDSHRAPTPNDIEELVAYLPRLCAPDFSPILKWGGGLNKETGENTFPWPVYAKVVEEFVEAASKECWMDPGYAAKDVNQLLEREDGLTGLDIDRIKSVLTFFVRGERFSDGHWGSMIESGHVRRLLERLGELQPG